LNSITGGAFLDFMKSYKLLKKVSVSCSQGKTDGSTGGTVGCVYLIREEMKSEDGGR
jgi:hypothetical protein